MLNAFCRKLRGLVRNLEEFRHCHSDDFRRLTLHLGCSCLKSFAEFARKSDRELIFHECNVMQCIALRQSGFGSSRWNIMRFAMFAAEAYNVEMGISNDVFPTTRAENPLCSEGINEPNDITRTDIDDARSQSFTNPLHILPDWLEFAIFMRGLAPPKPAPFSPSAQRGQQLFGANNGNPGIGCFLCHTPTMTSGPRNETEALENVDAHLYSDLLLHHMGSGLADNVTQGLAEGDMFRTTPLWGVGQRLFFLHDGRTSDLLAAITAHASGDDENQQGNGGAKDFGGRAYPPSEANAVIRRFNSLSVADRQAILDFLRAL
jgi:CxxC motif-containing protein (DUF1111 family)